MTKADWVKGITNVDKPWGYEEHFALVDGMYCGKALHISAGHALSLRYHEKKEETVSVQQDRLRFAIELHKDSLEVFDLLSGESIHLFPGTPHRMTTVVGPVVLDASTTELDNVVRLCDRYGRT